MVATAKTVTKSEVEDIVSTVVKSAVDDLTEVIASFTQNVHEELVEIREEIADIRVSFDRLTNTIDGFVKRLDDIEVDNAARDAQYQRLLAWAQKVSTKTGIPLKY